MERTLRFLDRLAIQWRLTLGRHYEHRLLCIGVSRHQRHRYIVVHLVLVLEPGGHEK